MGQVWRGQHRLSGTPVAIKVITGALATQPRWRQAFRREAQAVASLHHRGIIEVFDYGQIPSLVQTLTEGELRAGSPYLVMEFADVGSLEDVLSPSWSQLRWILLELLEALGHAHARHLVHLDLKPANVMLRQLPEGGSRAQAGRLRRGARGQPAAHRRAHGQRHRHRGHAGLHLSGADHGAAGATTGRGRICTRWGA